MYIKNNRIISAISLIAFFISNFLNAQTEIKVEYKSKGALYQLTIWKYAIESIMSKKSEDPKVQQDYNKIKAELDGAINQFEFEMNLKNKLVRKFNKINKAFKGNSFWSEDTDIIIEYNSIEELVDDGWRLD